MYNKKCFKIILHAVGKRIYSVDFVTFPLGHQFSQWFLCPAINTLHVGLPLEMIGKLKLVQNINAHLLTGTLRYYHVVSYSTGITLVSVRFLSPFQDALDIT